MIKLLSAHVKNFRSCIDTSLDFNSSLTALIGINGSGKTNALQALVLLSKFSRYYRGAVPKSALEDTSQSHVEFILEIDRLKYRLAADIYFDPTSGDDEIIHSNLRIRRVGSNSSWLKFEDEYLDYMTYQMHLFRPLRGKDILSGVRTTKNSDLKRKVVEYITSISYYSATQFSNPSQSPISLELDDRRVSRLDRSRSRNHEQFIYDLYETYESKKELFNSYIDIVGAYGLGLVDNIEYKKHIFPSSSVKVLNANRIKKIETNKRIVIPIFKIDDLSLSPNQLSEGTFKTLALVFYILSDNSSLLLIEEPEVCIHHGLLASIIELIKVQSATKQIIISTHSDYVLDKLKPENIVVIKKYPHEGTKAVSLTKSLNYKEYTSLKKYLNESGNLGEYWKESGF